MTTPQWLTDRINKFIPTLAPLQSEDEIKNICEKEVGYIRQQMEISPIIGDQGIVEKFKGKVNALHTYLTEYRNAVKDEIPCTDTNSYEMVIGKFATKTTPSSRRKVRLHYAHKYLKKSGDEIPFRAQSIVAVSDTKRRNPKYFYSQELITKAIALLESESYSHIALGLMALTGRRMSEILKTANFEIVSTEQDIINHPVMPERAKQFTFDFDPAKTLIFSGQLKTRDCPTAKVYPFPIPVLGNSDIITEALARLRKHPSIAELADKPVKACNAKADTIGGVCDSHFRKIIKDCVPKDLRAAYAQVCLVYCRKEKKRTDYEPFFAEILGHSEDDLDTSKKYKVFELLD